MIWLTWRQFRAQALAAAGALALLVVLLGSTGPSLAHAYSDGLTACTAQGDCTDFSRLFFNDHQTLFALVSAVVLFVPALIGLFWGAPLVAREVEAGTHRLVWSQTVTRGRWLAVKLGVGALAAVAVTGLASLAVSWWASPLDKVAGDRMPRIAPPIFDTRGIAPVGYALFAFALGVTLGILMRRTVPAMGVALAAFIAVQIAVPLLVRPHLIPPVRVVEAVTQANIDGFRGTETSVQLAVRPPDPNAWVLSNQTIDASGNKVHSLPSDLTAICVPAAAGGPGVSKARAPGFKAACMTAIAQRGYRQEIIYQPSSRFWPLQWIETGLFVAFALVLAAISVRRVRQLS